MHGLRLPTRAAAVILSIAFLSSCVSLISKKNTYDVAASSSAVKVNGASIRMQVKPEGTDGGTYAVSAMIVSAVAATFDGPFRWRIEAIGTPGQLQHIVIHRIRTRTEKTKRDEWYPVAHLGKRADFRLLKSNNALTRAIYPIPGLLKVKPREDGPLEIWIDMSVVAANRSKRERICFRMDPSQKRQDEFIFVPTEIVKSFGKSPADWEQSGWD